MFRKADEAIGKVTSIIQIGAALLVGSIMVFWVGWPLVSYGVGSGYVPLVIGICAFITAGLRTRELLRY